MIRKSSHIRRTSLAFLLICSALSPPARLFSQTRLDGKGASVRAVDRLPSKEKRWALIIGVSNYEDGNITPLPGANNDAKALRDALHDYAGFDEKQIILLTTDETKDRRPTKNNILRLLGNLSGTVPRDGLLLVAFSGHGIDRQNQAFLLASDTPYNDNLRVLERTALSVQNDVKELIRDTGVGQVIILLDACRNDPASGRSDSENPLTEAYEKGFSFDVRNKEVEAFATLYATSIGERAYEYTREGKGYFTWAFIEGLKGGAANDDGEVTLGGLVRYVEKYVPQQVRIDLGGSRVQRPFSIIEGYRAEELVLGVARNTNPSPRPVLPLESKVGEQIYWQETEKRNTIAAYENYLSRYPNGEFVHAAKLRLGKLRWMNVKASALAYLKYDYVDPFSYGVARVRLNGRTGYIDAAGREVIPPGKYDEIDNDFNDGLVRVQMNGKTGFADTTGKEVIPLRYEYGWYFSEGLCSVKLNDKSGFIDKMGAVVIPFKYDWVWSSFHGGIAGVKSGAKWGFIDKTGKEVIPFRYDWAHPFREGLARVQLNGKWGFVNRAGDEVVPIKYESAGNFSGGFAQVQLDEKWGFVDRSGKEALPIKYEEVGDFSEGLTWVRLGGKYMFIDGTGKEVFLLQGIYATKFSGGLAEAIKERKWGYIDKTGREVIPIKYERVWSTAFMKDGIVGVVLNSDKGYVDIYGNEYFDF